MEIIPRNLYKIIIFVNSLSSNDERLENQVHPFKDVGTVMVLRKPYDEQSVQSKDLPVDVRLSCNPLKDVVGRMLVIRLSNLWMILMDSSLLRLWMSPRSAY